MKSKTKVIIVSLLLIIGIVFFINNSSFSYFKKTKIQEVDNIVTTNCFEVALINDTNGINLIDAYPISDEEGLKLKPYTFTVKNVCQNEENVFIQLDMNKENTIDYSHVKVSLDGDVNLSPTLLNELVTSNSISDEVIEDYNRAKIMTTKKLSPEEEITLNVRMWLDYEKSDINDQNALFTSKVEIISSYNTEDVETMPYVLANTKYLGNKTIEATYNFKSDSVNVVSYAISEEKTDNPVWIDIENKTMDYTLVFNYTENKTYYLYVKDERGNTGSKVIEIDASDKEKPVINSTTVTTEVESIESADNNINVLVDATDDTELVKYYYSLDNENYIESTDNTYSFTNIRQEDYIVYVYVEDSSGNKSLVQTESVRVGTPAVRNVNTGNEYFSISKGASASNSGDTLIALRDIKESADIPTGKNFTFDIAGHTISKIDDTILDLYGDIVLTIIDSTWNEENPYGTGKITKGDSEIIKGVGAIYVNENATLNLNHVTITKNVGKSDGGGIMNDGILNISNCLISNNTANSSGGGIINKGVLNISNSEISNNTATSGGGGIITSNESNTTIVDSTIKDNNSLIGGGIYSKGTLILNNNVIIEGNSRTGNGGGMSARDIFSSIVNCGQVPTEGSW